MDIEEIRQYALQELELWDETESGDARDLGKLRMMQLLLVASIAESLNGINMSSVVKRVEALETQHMGLSGIVASLGYEERIAGLEKRVLANDEGMVAPFTAGVVNSMAIMLETQEQRIADLQAECLRLQNTIDREVVSLSRAINDLASYHN